MILTCPNCDTKFRVKDDAIGPNGRKVKCRNCAHVWHAMPEGADDAMAPPPPATKPAAPKPAQRSAPAKAAHPDDDGMDMADAPPPPPPPGPPTGGYDADPGDPPLAAPPPIPSDGDFVLRQRKPKIEKKSPVMAWVILVVLLVATAAAGFFFQKDIVQAYPPIAKVYSWVGITPNMLGHGLALPPPDTATAERTDKGLKLIISGQIKSELGERADIPTLRGALVDTSEQELHVWTFQADKPDILPGETVRYTTEVLNPPEGVTEARITFQSTNEPAMEESMMQGGETNADGHGETAAPASH